LLLQDEQEFINRLLNPATQQSAYRELVVKYQRPLYNLIRGMVQDHDDADDVLQNTFIKIFRHLDGFKGESRLFSWAYRIATNEALSFIKQKKRRGFKADPEVQERMMNNIEAESWADPEAIEARLYEAISNLPEKQKLVFEMRYFDEIPYEQMSEMLGTSVGALKASYHHAAKKIEDYVNKD
jgi:RNA polymerase sigma factor (sigma-70 family)